MSNGVHISQDRNDVDACISIGILAGPLDTKSMTGIIIGEACANVQPDSGKNILIGTSIMRASTSTDSRNNVLLGINCAKNQTGDDFSSNVCIGHNSCRDSTITTNVTGNVAIGSDSLREHVGSNIVCIGSDAGNV